MERLSGIDAGFLYMETPTLHMHTLKVAVLAPTPGADHSPAGLRRAMAERMHLLPPLRRRVVEVPFGLHHPVWVDDDAFDLAHHLRHAVAAPPGGARELDAVVSAIAGTPLDRRHPLWELWLVEGLAEGRVAAVAKIHHAVADGVAVAEMLANVMSPDPVAALPPAPPTPPAPEAPAPRGDLIRDALRERLRLARDLPRLTWTSLRRLAAVARQRRGGGVRLPRPMLDAPRTSFNGALTARRRFVALSLPLAEIGAVRAATGTTVNDVLLALVAGALRDYLTARGERPRLPLVAEVPVSTDRAGGARRLAGNRVANVFTSLCTDVEDPRERLRRIHEHMQAGKALNQTLGPELFQRWTEHTPPRPFAWIVRLYARLGLANLHPPPINVIVSSVPGPRQRLYWAEGSLHALYSVGPLVDGVGLNVTAWSYVDRLNVGLLSCPDLLADLDAVADGMRRALDVLLAAVAPAHAAECGGAA
jgi:diacylglycerol O-acyltransferase